MTRRHIKVFSLFCVLIGAMLVISSNSAACFSWTVSCSPDSRNVDRGDYTFYEIVTNFWPGCRSTYYVSFFNEGVPFQWMAEILDEKGLVIPEGTETILSGTVSYIFTLKVQTPSIPTGMDTATITTHIRATDYYNQDDLKDVVTTTTINSGNKAPNPVVLSQLDNSTESITLQWTESDLPPGEFGKYELHMSLVPGFTPVSGTRIATFTDQGTLNFEVTGLSPESTYYFCIRVWDNDGVPGPYFADSNILEAMTRGINDPPTPVFLYDPEDVTHCDANLSWTENTDEDFASYEIHVSTESGFKIGPETLFGDPITDQADLRDLVTGLAENATYYFKVRVYDTGGLFADSNEVNCKTLDAAPDQITLYDPFDTGVTSTNLQWETCCITDFHHYEVHISQTPGFIPGPGTKYADIFNISTDTILIEDLEEETLYYFCLRVYDESGQYMDSNMVSVKTLDGTLPRIIHTTPVNNAVGVGLSQAIIVTFSEEMDTASVNFVCTPNPGGWSSIWSNGYQTITYYHNDFESLETYQFHITSGMDLGGNALIAGEVPNPWSFETEDKDPPTITFTSPLNNAVDVPIDTVVYITFSETMDTSSVILSCTPNPKGWQATWSNSDKTVTFIHNPFDDQTTYTLQITQAKDLAGNDLVEGDIENPWSFITEDLTPPAVIECCPTDSTQDVDVTTTVFITFSEDMNQESVISALTTTFSYETATWNGNTLTLTPSGDLDYDTQYTLSVSTDAKDTSGNQMTETFSLTFTTGGPTVTNRPPSVSVTSPDGDTARDSFTIIWTATDEDGDPLIINIYYDSDTNSQNGMTVIAEDVTNSGSYLWDTSELAEGDYYIYITANDGNIEMGSYSGIITIDHPDDTGGDDTGGDDTPTDPGGDVGVNDKKGSDSILWTLLWILLCAIIIITLLAAMVYRRRRENEPKTCGACKKQFTPFDSRAASADCPHCGQVNHF